MRLIQQQQTIDEALELLYGSTEDEIRGVHNILSVLCDNPDGVPSDFIKNHQLLAALARLLGEDTPRPIELTFAIGKIFLSLSLNEEFHHILSSHRIGALALGVVALECKRASHLWTKCTKTDEVNPSGLTTDISAAREYSVSPKQARVMYVFLGILDNLADDIAILGKMMKKSLVDVLTRCFQLESSECLLVSISLMKKASIFKETAHELSRAGCKVISRLGQLLRDQPSTAIQRDVATLLFNLSFHEGCSTLISSMNVISRLVKFLQKSVQCVDTLQLIYHLSTNEKNRHDLFDAGVSPCLLNHIQKGEKLNMALVGLLANMTLQPLCCEHLMSNGIINILFRIIQKSQQVCSTQMLLKVVRNLCRWTNLLQSRLAQELLVQGENPLLGIVQDPEPYLHSKLYWEKHFWDPHVDFTLKCTLECEDNDLLVEWLGVLNNFTPDDLPAGVQWSDLLDDNKSRVVGIFQKLLESSTDDDVKLELIIWFGELCSSRECIYWLASTDLFNIIHSVFVEQKDSEMKLQILHIYEHCLLFETSRLQVVGEEGVMRGLLGCLREEDDYVRFAAERCLVVIDELDRDEDGVMGEISSLIHLNRYEVLMMEQ